MRKFAWIVSIVLLLVTGAAGLLNAANEFRNALSPLQFSVALGGLLYGILGVTAALGLMRRRAWSVRLALAWAVIVVYVGTVASFAYSDPWFQRKGTLAGVLGAFVGTALIGALVAWTARVGLRDTALPSVTQNDHIPPR